MLGLYPSLVFMSDPASSLASYYLFDDVAPSLLGPPCSSRRRSSRQQRTAHHHHHHRNPNPQRRRLQHQPLTLSPLACRQCVQVQEPEEIWDYFVMETPRSPARSAQEDIESKVPPQVNDSEEEFEFEPELPRAPQSSPVRSPRQGLKSSWTDTDETLTEEEEEDDDDAQENEVDERDSYHSQVDESPTEPIPMALETETHDVFSFKVDEEGGGGGREEMSGLESLLTLEDLDSTPTPPVADSEYESDSSTFSTLPSSLTLEERATLEVLESNLRHISEVLDPLVDEYLEMSQSLFDNQVTPFKDLSPKQLQTAYIKVSELLLQSLLKVDGLLCGTCFLLRQKRKKCVQRIQSQLDQIDVRKRSIDKILARVG